MRYIRHFNEHHDSISKSYTSHSKSYDCSLEDINSGHCDQISYDVIKDVVGSENYTSMSDVKLDEISQNTVYEIDDGVFWSNDIISEYVFKGDYWDIDTINFFGETPFNPDLLNTFTLKGHSWIYYNKKHYDVEMVNGTDNFWNLPIYQRQLKSLGITGNQRFVL
jgi:hypothetical protein